MSTNEKFRVNYYVSGLLAQGGELWIDASKIVFSPTSALDRAMGAKTLEIPFEHVVGMNYTGALSRFFLINTGEKVHKFEGGMTKRVWEVLEKALPKKAMVTPATPQHKPAPITAPAKPTTGLTCVQCAKPLQPYYSFCPHCAARIKTNCPSCQKAIDPSWMACAFCGRRIHS